MIPRSSQNSRERGSGGSYNTDGNHWGTHQLTPHTRRRHQPHHDRPWASGSSISSRNSWNLSTPWNRGQIYRESSDINNNINTWQRTGGPGYHDQHYGGNSWPLSHREGDFHEPYFSSRESSSAYAPTCDYVVPTESAFQTTSSSSRIIGTPPVEPLTSYSVSRPKTEKQTTPSQEYLEATLETSTYLDDPTSSKKLLILDLNGTLLYRSPHRRPGQYHSHHHHRDNHHRSELSRVTTESSEPHFDPYADPTIQRPLRPVHPRPFLPSFRQYLFHTKTRLWLDTMIWSSAQPHSVSDMVKRCFGGNEDELIAVWARDTLGLSEEQYHRKSQTTKDLNKPWAFLSPPLSSREPNDSASAPQLPPNRSRTVHSAHTTILLDDSPLKAHLQPWNHICIKEYVAEMRSADVEAAQLMSKPNAGSAFGSTAEDIRPVAHQGGNVGAFEKKTTSEQQSVEQGESRKRKRQLKKIVKKEKKMMLQRQKLSGQNPIECRIGKLESKGLWRKFDCTLLAVIGVLDAVRRESNVAAWVRKGGLRMAGEGRKLSEEADGGDDTSESTGSHETDLDSNASEANDRKRQRRASAGNSEALSVDPVISDRMDLWFEDEQTTSYWIARGVRSLKELDIGVDPGVKVS